MKVRGKGEFNSIRLGDDQQTLKFFQSPSQFPIKQLSNNFQQSPHNVIHNSLQPVIQQQIYPRIQQVESSSNTHSNENTFMPKIEKKFNWDQFKW